MICQHKHQALSDKLDKFYAVLRMCMTEEKLSFFYKGHQPCSVNDMDTFAMALNQFT